MNPLLCVWGGGSTDADGRPIVGRTCGDDVTTIGGYQLSTVHHTLVMDIGLGAGANTFSDFIIKGTCGKIFVTL